MNCFNKKMIFLLIFIIFYSVTFPSQNNYHQEALLPRLPTIDPANYPQLSSKNTRSDAKPQFGKELGERGLGKPSKPDVIDAPHRWSTQRGFIPLTRKDFPRWINDKNNPIARRWYHNDYQKRAANLWTNGETYTTTALKSLVSAEELGKKPLPPFATTPSTFWSPFFSKAPGSGRSAPTPSQQVPDDWKSVV